MIKIAITGTKGKTTIVRLIRSILEGTGHRTLSVDTDRARSSSTRREVTSKESLALWGLGSTVCPGRFIYLAPNESVGIFECSVGCQRQGLGYKSHDIGVFTNVYSDHISKNGDIRNRQDLAAAKSFIFNKIKPGGTAIVNIDDKLVYKQAQTIKESIRKVGFSLKTKCLPDGYSELYTIEGGYVVLIERSTKKRLLLVESIGWTFSGKYKPSLFNLLAVIACLKTYFGKIDDKLVQEIESSRVDTEGGRLNVFRLDNGVTLIADFAHEKESLKEIGRLSGSLGARNIGVLRLASRPGARVKEVAASVAKEFASIFVYNKVDGDFTKSKKPIKLESNKKTFDLFCRELKKNNQNVYCIGREDEALEAAIRSSRSGDCIVHIVGLDAKKSLNLINKYLPK